MEDILNSFKNFSISIFIPFDNNGNNNITNLISLIKYDFNQLSELYISSQKGEITTFDYALEYNHIFKNLYTIKNIKIIESILFNNNFGEKLLIKYILSKNNSIFIDINTINCIINYYLEDLKNSILY